MKTLEQKAKAYDGLIERLKDLKFACRFSPLSDTIDDIFPELKESEDERIREALIKFMERFPYDRLENDGVSVKDAIAWIEKQAQNSAWSEEDKNMLKWVIGYLENKMLNTPISEERTACKNAIDWLLEKQGEQKPTDKVEPKFKKD